MKLTLNNATVAYPVSISTRDQSLFGSAAAALSFGRIGKNSNQETFVMGLRNFDIEIKEGTRIGLIGRNGSGKSTLLKTLAGILTPQSGTRIAECTVGCVLNIGSGLDAERTGIDNLKMIARLYGLNGADYRNAIDDAAEFSDLGPFLNLPVRTYSSGMTARLCFSIATARHSDVMLIDEVIGTGDAPFLAKAVTRVKEICAKSGAVVIASHANGILNEFCDEAIWMHQGKTHRRGELSQIVKDYNDWNAVIAESAKNSEV